MKKTYFSPEIQVVLLAPQNVLAGSGKEIPDSNIDGTGTDDENDVG